MWLVVCLRRRIYRMWNICVIGMGWKWRVIRLCRCCLRRMEWIVFLVLLFIFDFIILFVYIYIWFMNDLYGIIRTLHLFRSLLIILRLFFWGLTFSSCFLAFSDRNPNNIIIYDYEFTFKRMHSFSLSLSNS